MPFPDLLTNDVEAAIPEATGLQLVGRGGQKVVFRGQINGTDYAVKLLKPNPTAVGPAPLPGQSDPAPLDDVTARAEREVRTMKQCKCPYLVKIGPIEIRSVKVGGEDLLCFTEEFIEGANLAEHLRSRGPMGSAELCRLGIQIAQAIDELWKLAKIHRDIKPGNIMRRVVGGEFVLLDMGLVFDLNDTSWSLGPVGTMMYFSPEQMDFSNRRQILDHRSDQFSLGIVLYEMGTGQHPFVTPSVSTSWDILANIRKMSPKPPSQLNSGIPADLNDIILRLLGKRPALRFRREDMLIKALQAVT